jgi:hypothetical protein
MSEAETGAARARAAKYGRPSPVSEDEILDWDTPPIDSLCSSETIRVQVRDVQAEPMLDL